MFNSPDSATSRAADEVFTLDKAWVFTREYPNISPNTLFEAMAKSLQDVPFFKVWKVDNGERYIDLTTHSIRLNPKVNYHQVQAELKVLQGKDPSTSAVYLRIMPTLTGIVSQYELFTNIDVNDKFAKYVSNLIFEAIEEGYRKF